MSDNGLMYVVMRENGLPVYTGRSWFNAIEIVDCCGDVHERAELMEYVDGKLICSTVYEAMPEEGSYGEEPQLWMSARYERCY